MWHTTRESAHDCVIETRDRDTEPAPRTRRGGVELTDPTGTSTIDLKPQAFSDAADQETARHFEEILTDWCDKTEALLDVSEDAYAMSAKEDAGPDTQGAQGGRMAKFNSITEQLKEGARLVLGVSMAGTQAHKRWKAVETGRGRSNESKDNVKYFITLENPMTRCTRATRGRSRRDPGL